MPDYYCVGPSMAADWGNDGPPLSRALVQRVFCYFVPYWRRALIVLGCIGVSAGLGLALPGSLIQRGMRCGWAGCRCHHDPPELHGPYGAAGGAVATQVWCAGSYRKRCGRLECMAELTPQRLWPVLQEVLTRWRPSGPSV